jgi:hypothetical protein
MFRVRLPLPLPRPLPSAILNLALEGASVVLGWMTRVEYGAIVLALLCLPLSVVVLQSVHRDLEAYPHPCRERLAARTAAVLWLPTLVLGLAMAWVLTGKGLIELFLAQGVCDLCSVGSH